MSDREASIFVIKSDKNQTIKELIVNNQEEIITAIKLSYDIYYNIYTENSFDMGFNVKKGQAIVAIFSVNSAGYWQSLQVLPAKFGSSNIQYYTEREQISMPG